MHKRKQVRPILPPRPKRRKDQEEQSAPVIFPAIPPRVEDLRGARFGMLYVRAYAGMDAHNKSIWCCECDCGALVAVPRSRLLGNSGRDRGHPQVSCGCRKQDPAVQRAARLKLSPARRREIAAKARAARKRGSAPYALSEEQAARILQCEPENIRQMANNGELRSIQRAGKMCYSVSEVDKWQKIQKRNSRHCKALDGSLLEARDAAPD